MLSELLIFPIWILSTAALCLVWKESTCFYVWGLHWQQAVQFTTAAILPITHIGLLLVLMCISLHLSLCTCDRHPFPLFASFLCIALYPIRLWTLALFSISSSVASFFLLPAVPCLISADFFSFSI